MKRAIFSVASLFLASSIYAQTDCTVNNSAWTAPLLSGGAWSDFQTDATQHNSPSNHQGYSVVQGTCKYSGAPNSGYCSVTCSSVTYAGKYEGGDLSVLGSHDVELATVQGASSFDGGYGEVTPPTATCGGQSEYAAQWCYATLSGVCGLSVSIGGAVAGLNGSVSINDATVWKAGYTFPHTCGAYISPSCSIPMPFNEICNAFDVPTCQWTGCRILSHTPIIIDTDGSGFHLTSVDNGVKFDFLGTGQPIQIPWTAPGSTNGWLALDDGSGTITSAKQLFSNVAAQPANPSDPNAPDGFNDLSQYDVNHDGVINSEDPVWPKLLIWIDSNHDGISQPNELHHLSEFGITGIDVKYSVSPMTDQYGNKFHLKGHLSSAPGDHTPRVIYDVYLTQAGTTPAQTTAKGISTPLALVTGDE